MYNIIVYENKRFGNIRTFVEEGKQEPWFVAADVCRALEVKNARDAVARLDDDEKNTVVLTDGNRGNPNVTVVSEPGLYALVISSRKPEAKEFKRWITHDVIPSIRKSGGYIAGQEDMSDADLIAKALIVAQRQIEQRNKQITEMQPKALFADAVSASKISILVNEMAKLLRQNGVEICGNGTVPRPDKGKWKSAGEVVGDGYSVAWRQLDAQYWGVPQRRKRIYLVADFAGGRAGEILFEREGMQGHPAACGTTGQGAAADAAGSAGRSRGLESLNPLDCQSNRVYRSQKFGEYAADGTASTIAARDFKSPRDLVVEHPPTYGVDCRNAALDEEKTHTLQAKANGGQSLNCTPSVLTSGKPPRKYIIRRLTPLECCRLQGFPDGWGVPDHKDKLSDEELVFWQGVRDTCAAISGKPSKRYSAKALTKWYNALHTDSAEYKMWGNGIALPCAQFVLGGVAEAIQERINNSHL